MNLKRKVDDMANGNNPVVQSSVIAFPGERPLYDSEISKKQSKYFSALLSWLWKWLQIYLHNIYVITMPEKPRTNWPMVISILTFAGLLLTIWWQYSDRLDRAFKETKQSGIEIGTQQEKELQRDREMQALRNQIQIIEEKKKLKKEQEAK